MPCSRFPGIYVLRTWPCSIKEDSSGEHNEYHAETLGIGNSIIVDGNYISHMNNSERDDKNRFCISTEQGSKTQATKTPKQEERQSDTRTLDTRQDNDKAHVQVSGTQYQKEFKRSAGLVLLNPF